MFGSVGFTRHMHFRAAIPLFCKTSVTQLWTMHNPREIKFAHYLGLCCQGMGASFNFQASRWSTQQPQPSLCVSCETQPPRTGATAQSLTYSSSPAAPSFFLPPFFVSSLVYTTKGGWQRECNRKSFLCWTWYCNTSETGHSLCKSKQPVYMTGEGASEPIRHFL